MRYSVLARAGDPNPFVPFDYQVEFMDYMLDHTKEKPARACCVWPRRHGKDLTALHQLAVMAHDRVGVYWHGLPSYEQARKSCWNAFRTDTGQRLMDNVFPREIVKRPNEWSPSGEMLVELKNGSIIQFVGSDNVDNMVGAGIVGLNATEYALWQPSAFAFIQPMLRESCGWATFLFTPRGHNHAFDLYERAQKDARWFVSHKTVFSAGKYTKEQAERLLIDEAADGMLPEVIRQEYLCDFTASNIGSFWGDALERLENEGALGPFTPDSMDNVYVSFDLGMNDETALWAFTINNKGVDYLAHYSCHSQPIAHYFDQLTAWSDEHGFKYKAFLLPHDAAARTLLTGTSVFDEFVERYGSAMVRPVPNIGLLDGIQAARKLLLTGKVRIHPRCALNDGIEALRQYHRKYDEVRRTFILHPEHDWSSHSADAFRYSAVGMKMLRNVDIPTKKVVPVYTMPKLPSLEQLFKEREGRIKRFSPGRA